MRNLKVKVSGCFHSCVTHHLADIGFYGVMRKRGGYSVPFFQLVLGGQWDHNGGSYGLAMGAIPSRRVPEALDRITGRFVESKEDGESFQDFVRRVGKAKLRAAVEDLMEVPGYDEDRSFYSDWRDPREYSTGDMGIGECAGEIVSLVDFGLAAAERQVFEAQIALEEQGDQKKAYETAVKAMLTAARELVKVQWQDVPDDTKTVVSEFRKRFYDTRLFFDKYAGAKFANYFLSSIEKPLTDFSDGKVTTHPDSPLEPIVDAFAKLDRRVRGRHLHVHTGAIWEHGVAIPVLPYEQLMRLLKVC